MGTAWLRLGLALALLAAGACARDTGTAPARVAAASDLQYALTDLATEYSASTGEQVEVTFGSSGTLTRQIMDGAPFEVFLSADESFVQRLVDAGLTRDGGDLYAVGRIVLFAPAGSPLEPDEGLEGLGRLLAEGRVPRFAMANPEHAPYGRAAEQALRRHGLWDAVQPALVLGENVTQAAQFATTGNAAGGIIAYSLALAPAMRDRGRHALIAADDHTALRQRMVRLARAGPVAERFYQFLRQPPARETLSRYGFARPE